MQSKDPSPAALSQNRKDLVGVARAWTFRWKASRSTKTSGGSSIRLAFTTKLYHGQSLFPGKCLKLSIESSWKHCFRRQARVYPSESPHTIQRSGSGVGSRCSPRDGHHPCLGSCSRCLAKEVRAVSCVWSFTHQIVLHIHVGSKFVVGFLSLFETSRVVLTEGAPRNYFARGNATRTAIHSVVHCIIMDRANNCAL